jgi:hypothetical protein
MQAAIETSKMQKRILERRQKVLEDQASKGKADAQAGPKNGRGDCWI